MTYTPILPVSGYSGWAFLKRTMSTQKAAFDSQKNIAREEDYFRKKIGTISKADDLVNDRQLLKIALGAFGLDSDISNKFFIRKVLEDGTLKTDALANRLANKQYRKFSAAFGFGDFSTPSTKLSDFADKILAQYKDRQFEIAVGEQDDTMRLAMTAVRELLDLAKSSASDRTKWYTVLGNAPLRQVFETTYGLPSAFGALDVDRQVSVLQEKTRAAFGKDGFSQFSEEGVRENLVRRFLLSSEIASFSAAQSSASIALTLLQSQSQYS